MTTTFKVQDGDISLDSTNGRPVMISDRVKVSQDITEMLVIDAQSDNGFGAGLDSLVGQLNDADDISMGSLNFQFGFRIRQSFERLKALQRNFQFGQRSLAELIDRITYIRIEPSRSDKTLFRFFLNAITVGGDPVKRSGTLFLRGNQ